MRFVKFNAITLCAMPVLRKDFMQRIARGLTKIWWADGSDDGPEEVTHACLQTTVLSKDGKLTVTGSPRIARKKGQRQRPRAERTIHPLKWQFNFCFSAVNLTFYAVFCNVFFFRTIVEVSVYSAFAYSWYFLCLIFNLTVMVAVLVLHFVMCAFDDNNIQVFESFRV